PEMQTRSLLLRRHTLALQDRIGDGARPNIETMTEGIERLSHETVEFRSRQRSEPPEALAQLGEARILRLGVRSGAINEFGPTGRRTRRDWTLDDVERGDRRTRLRDIDEFRFAQGGDRQRAGYDLRPGRERHMFAHHRLPENAIEQRSGLRPGIILGP